MNNKLDVFEILNANNNKNQEQQNAPDFNFLNVRELMQQIEKESVQKQPPKPDPKPVAKPVQKPAPKPEPKPEIVIKPHTEPAKTPKTVPVQKPTAAQQPETKIELTPEKTEKDKPEKSFGKGLVKLAVLAALIAVLMIFVIGYPKVSSNSMEPMIGNGDHVVINKLAKKYRHGDIIVFKSTSGEKLVARIVAVDGDVVSINNIGGLYVNNQLQTEENIHTVTTITDTAVNYPVIVDEDTYFVLGDNRTDSIDSRNSDIGLVEEKDIVGKVIFCFKKI